MPFAELFLDLIELVMSLPFFKNYTGSLLHTASLLNTIELLLRPLNSPNPHTYHGLIQQHFLSYSNRKFMFFILRDSRTNLMDRETIGRFFETTATPIGKISCALGTHPKPILTYHKPYPKSCIFTLGSRIRIVNFVFSGGRI